MPLSLENIKIRLLHVLKDEDLATKVALKLHKYLTTIFSQHIHIDTDTFLGKIQEFIKQAKLPCPEVKLHPPENIYKTFLNPYFPQISSSICTKDNKRTPLIHRDIIFSAPARVTFRGSFVSIARLSDAKIKKLQEEIAASGSCRKKFGRRRKSYKTKGTRETTVKKNTGKKTAAVKKQKLGKDAVKGATVKKVKSSKRKSNTKATLAKVLTKENKKVPYDEAIKGYIAQDLGLRARK